MAFNCERPHFGLSGHVRVFQGGPAVAGSPHPKVNRASEETGHDYSILRRTEKWANDSARAFIREIGEEVRDADDDNELKRRSVFHLTTNRHELTRIGRAHHSVRAATSTTKRGKAIRHSDFVIVSIRANSCSLVVSK